MPMLFAALAVVLVSTRVYCYPTGQPTSEHDHHQILSLVDDFLEYDMYRANSWDPSSKSARPLQLKYDHLVEIINTSGAHRYVIESLLHLAGQDRESSKRYDVLVWKLWATFSTHLLNERDLLLRLLSDTSFMMDSGKDSPLLEGVIGSFSPSMLSSTADDPRSVLEHIIERKRGQSLNRFDVTILELLRKNSLVDDVERARIRSAHCLPPLVWVDLFHKDIDNSAAEPHEIVPMLESSLVDIPEHEFLKSALIMRCAWPRKRALQLFAAIDVRQIIHHLGRLVNEGVVDGDNIFPIAYLFEHCIKFDDLQELLLDQIPSMFTTTRQVVGFLSGLRSDYLHFRYCERLRCKFVCKLLSLLLNSRPDLIVTALDVDSLLCIVSVISSFDRNIPTIIEQANAIEISLDIYNKYPQHEDDLDVATTTSTLRPVLFSLIFCQMVECKIREDWLIQIENVSDAELSFACALASTKSDSFQRFMKDLSSINATFFNRISHLIPDHVAPKPAPEIKFYSPLMDVRSVSNVADDYEILNRLGSGSFGTVFRGRCLRGMSNMEVAIKVVRSEERSTADEIEFMSKFCVGDQRLPGLVQLLDMFRCGGYTFFVMELVQGRMLVYWPVPATSDEAASKLVEIVYQMLVIFEQISERGYSHRDVFFRNLMIDEISNRLVVLDFGQALRLPGLDFGPVLDRVRDLLYRIHSHLNRTWYERSSGLLWEFEQALNRWIIGPQTFRSVLHDSIFDRVRDQFQPSRSQKYDDFPVMSKSILNVIPALPDSNSLRPVLETFQDRDSLPMMSQSGCEPCTNLDQRRPSSSLTLKSPLSPNGTHRRAGPDEQPSCIPPITTSLPSFILPPESSMERSSSTISGNQQEPTSSTLNLSKRHGVVPLLDEANCIRCPEPSVQVDSIDQSSVLLSQESIGDLCHAQDQIETTGNEDPFEFIQDESDLDPALQSSLNSDIKDAAVSQGSNSADTCNISNHAAIESSSIQQFWLWFVVVTSVVAGVIAFAVVALKRRRSLASSIDAAALL